MPSVDRRRYLRSAAEAFLRAALSDDTPLLHDATNPQRADEQLDASLFAMCRSQALVRPGDTPPGSNGLQACASIVADVVRHDSQVAAVLCGANREESGRDVAVGEPGHSVATSGATVRAIVASGCALAVGREGTGLGVPGLARAAPDKRSRQRHGSGVLGTSDLSPTGFGMPAVAWVALLAAIPVLVVVLVGSVLWSRRSVAGPAQRPTPPLVAPRRLGPPPQI